MEAVVHKRSSWYCGHVAAHQPKCIFSVWYNNRRIFIRWALEQDRRGTHFGQDGESLKIVKPLRKRWRHRKFFPGMEKTTLDETVLVILLNSPTGAIARSDYFDGYNYSPFKERPWEVERSWR